MKSVPSRRLRIDLILNKTRISAQGGGGGGWDHELLGYDLEDRPNLNHYFAALDQIFDAVRHAAELGWNAAVAIDHDLQPKLKLRDADDEPEQPEAVASILELTKGLAKACGWSILETSDTLTVNLTTGYQRPRNQPELEKSSSNYQILIPARESNRRLATSQSSFGRLCYFAHSEMCAQFKPNVAKAPLPEPFIISLPMPEPTFDTGHVATPKLLHIRCAAPKAPGDSVRIAVANLAAPACG